MTTAMRAGPGNPTSAQMLTAFLSTHALFGVLPAEVLSQIADRSVVRQYTRGHHIWQPGDVTAHVGVVRSGLVAITELDEHGNACSVMTKGRGDLLAPLITMNQITQYGWSTPLVDVEMVLVPREEFERVFRAYPDFAVELLRYVSQMFYRFRKTIIRRTYMSTTSRIADFLLESAAVDTPKTELNTVALALSHKDLALVLGTTRETVSRTLHQFSRAGLISVSRRRIDILRPNALRDIALS